MKTIRIEISGTYMMPRWETIQTLIREMVRDDDGMLVKIDRINPDGTSHGDYGSPGVYDLRWRFSGPVTDLLTIELVVTEPTDDDQPF